MCTVLDVVENRGRVAGLEEGMEKGRREGKEEGGSLINYLWLNGRGGEAQLALKDQDLYDRLLEEYKAKIHLDDVAFANTAVKE